MPGVEDAKSIEELAAAAKVMYDAAVANYHAANVSMWKVLTGEVAQDNDKLTKNLTTVVGQMMRDAGNLQMVWTQLAKIAAPPAGQPNQP